MVAERPATITNIATKECQPDCRAALIQIIALQARVPGVEATALDRAERKGNLQESLTTCVINGVLTATKFLLGNQVRIWLSNIQSNMLRISVSFRCE